MYMIDVLGWLYVQAFSNTNFQQVGMVIADGLVPTCYLFIATTWLIKACANKLFICRQKFATEV